MTLKQFLMDGQLNRGKRNLSDYDRVGEISEEEALELLKETKAFRATVLDWVKKHHPRLAPR